tara:strand:+ start:4550 stop:4675 length:126 start_codon:yes stop_codon:yes gene_type:complete
MTIDLTKNALLEMKDKLIDLGEIKFLKWIEETYQVDLGVSK